MRFTPPRSLAPTDETADFSCGQPTLDEWLVRTALRAERDHTARTYVVCDADNPHRIVGYYCLSTCSIQRETIGGGKLARNAPLSVPAILLGRLAVDLKAQGYGLGASLLHDAIDNAELVSLRVGSRALIVDALNESAAAFYAKYAFRPFPSDPLRLFHPL